MRNSYNLWSGWQVTKFWACYRKINFILKTHPATITVLATTIFSLFFTCISHFSEQSTMDLWIWFFFFFFGWLVVCDRRGIGVMNEWKGRLRWHSRVCVTAGTLTGCLLSLHTGYSVAEVQAAPRESAGCDHQVQVQKQPPGAWNPVQVKSVNSLSLQ